MFSIVCCASGPRHDNRKKNDGMAQWIYAPIRRVWNDSISIPTASRKKLRIILRASMQLWPTFIPAEGIDGEPLLRNHQAQNR